MEDSRVLAAILTVALYSTSRRENSKKTSPERWRNVWSDYKRFLKKLEELDESIDARGIKPG